MSEPAQFAAYKSAMAPLPPMLWAGACRVAQAHLKASQPDRQLAVAYMALPDSVRLYWMARLAAEQFTRNGAAFDVIVTREAVAWRKLHPHGDPMATVRAHLYWLCAAMRPLEAARREAKIGRARRSYARRGEDMRRKSEQARRAKGIGPRQAPLSVDERRRRKNEQNRAYRAAHVEELAAAARAWAKDHPAQRAKYQRAYYVAHREHLRDYYRNFHKARREQLRVPGDPRGLRDLAGRFRAAGA